MLFPREKTELVDVAIPLPVEDPFTYEVPAEWIGKIKPGMRVMVPFKNRAIIGFAVKIKTEIPPEKTKPIAKPLDPEPTIGNDILALAFWMKETYFSSWGEAIQTAVPGFLRKTRVAAPRKKNTVVASSEKPKPLTLTPDQDNAVTVLSEMIQHNAFASVLLYGVTGSGKTEVYIRAIQETLGRGKSAICLVPEIALTEQIERFFSVHFGAELEIIHSKLSDGERWQAWNRIRQGEKRVILGARSAVFSPVQNLGLIVIDEEQEPSYKQDQTPRYHTRDIAKWRAEHAGGVLLLGSATPSVEMMHETQCGSMRRLELPNRIGARPMPDIEIVDLNQAEEIAKSRIIISSRLKMTMAQALEKGGGILLLLNRRGFSTQTRCLACRKTILCRHCQVSLTYHQEDDALLCHYCNYKLERPTGCPECGSELLKFSGVGTEKVESEVARFFPAARIARLDSDSIRRKGSHEEILSKFRKREIDILVGTQMIAKGFDFPHVTLVGVILADTALLLPDFRSGEKTFQLLSQVAGRSGRGEQPGRVIVQTYSPLHYSIQHARLHAAGKFFEEETAYRKQFEYPPFVRLINLMVRGRKEKQVIEQAHLLGGALTKTLAPNDAEMIGPAPLPFSRLRGQFRWHCMVKIKSNREKVMRELRNTLRTTKRLSKIHIAIDVDPVSIL